MKPIAVAVTSPSQTLKALRNVLNDALYRGSLYLLANNVAMAAIGFIFWTLAAHRYSASTVGVFSGVTSGVSLLAAISAVGLPITLTRHIAGAKDPRQLVLMAVAVIATVGTILCVATVLFFGPHLPAALHIQQRGIMTLVVTVLVVFTAASTTLDAGLVATRSSRVVLIKNLAGSIAKLVAMLLLATLRSSGLIISFGLGLVLATVLSGVALGRRIRTPGVKFRALRLPWGYLSATSVNYLATVIGILPSSVVPIEVLAARGAAETARFSIAFLISGFLGFIPSTTGQVLFAEIARGGAPLGKQLRKAFRAVYGLLLPPLVVLLAAAPLVLRLFGQAYAAQATGCLRVLALSTLPAGGSYLIISVLIARDRIAAYTLMQIANAALILGGVGLLLPRGLTAAATGLAIGEVVTLILCLLMLPIGKSGRHHLQIADSPTEEALPDPRGDEQPQPEIYAFEPQIRGLIATWPMMPTALIAEDIGWDQSIQVLLDRVTELRSEYADWYQSESDAQYLPGQAAQCSLWFPPIEIPVGSGQIRSAMQLPVLTMITAYSRWISAILIPSTRPEDLFAGWWKLLSELGAVPRLLNSHSARAIGWPKSGQSYLTTECSAFCRSLSTHIVPYGSGDLRATGLIEQVHAYLERSFLYDRAFESPQDFNIQLSSWLTTVNTRGHQLASRPPAGLIAADREAMLPLPPIPPATGWRLFTSVGNRPYVHFDSNYYSVDPAVTGHSVELVADLRRVLVLCDSAVAGEHPRSWTRGQVIDYPAHRGS